MGRLILSAFADEYSSVFDEQTEMIKRIGFSHIELRFADGINIADIDREKLEEIKHKLKAASISVSSIGSPIGKIGIDSDFSDHLVKARHVFHIAHKLGAPFVRIFSFYLPRASNKERYKDEVISRLSALLDAADEYGITLCLENEEGLFGESHSDCLTLLEAFGGRLGSVFDMGNFVLCGYDVKVAYETLKPYIRYFHIKDALYSGAIVPPGKGDALIKEILLDQCENGEDSVFITLEPHLEVFDGLNTLTDRHFDNPYRYDSSKAAFLDAVEKIKELINMEHNIRELKKDKLTVKIADSRDAMGSLAATEIKGRINTLLESKSQLNIIFAAAPSQNEVLSYLVSDRGIDWSRINAYHMDEYIGLPKGAPQAFGHFLSEHIFSLLPFNSINYIDPQSTDPYDEARRYGELIEKDPPDIVVMGIGENGHIAFNDPPVADFNDPFKVKPVLLDSICRKQQVNDGCFASLDDVPTHAITLTVPTLFSAPYLFCIVPSERKAWAVRETLCASIDEHCPASILRLHDNATLYLDKDSASML